MELQESDFHQQADAYLESLFEQIEQQDEDGGLDIDLQDGILLIEGGGHEFVINKHSASQQIWMSSPLSGGLHFSPTDAGKDWKLADGRRLSVVLAEELGMVTGVNFTIEV